jgi:tetratricopeptide (TPR) repeat protein
VANAWLKNYDTALHHLEQAIAGFRTLGNLIAQANSTISVAWLLDRWERHEDGLVYAQRALDLFTSGGWHHGRAIALGTLGWQLALLGRYQEAVPASEAALALSKELDSTTGIADASDTLGYIHHHLGQPEQAISLATPNA